MVGEEQESGDLEDVGPRLALESDVGSIHIRWMKSAANYMKIQKSPKAFLQVSKEFGNT